MMAEFKLTIADPKTGKCVQKTVTDQAAESLIGVKIGDTLKGETLDLTGYEFLITGGSDFFGFPMRKGISGARKRILIGRSVGFRGKPGIRKRRPVCGEIISEQIVQINLKITKKGKKPIAADAEKSKISGTTKGEKEAEKGAEGEAKKEAPAEKPAEAPKEEAKESPAEAPKEKAREEQSSSVSQKPEVSETPKAEEKK